MTEPHDQTIERPEPQEYGALAVMTRKLEGENRTIRFTGTTAIRDRYQSDIPLTGWDTKWYMGGTIKTKTGKSFKTHGNPVVLWAHDHHIPGVGLTERLVREEIDGVDGWVFDVDFNKPVEDFRLPEVLFQYAKDKRIRACSVGFISHASTWIDPDTDEEKEWRDEHPDLRQDKVFKKKELLELSICNVGANPQALQAWKQNAFGAASKDLRDHLAWIEREITGNDRTGVIYVPMSPALDRAPLYVPFVGHGQPETVGYAYGFYPPANSREIQARPGWDDKKENSEIRYRVREPDLFDAETFVRVKIVKTPPRVIAIMGKLKGETTLSMQALRFPRGEPDNWTLEKAKAWLKEHKDITKAIDELLADFDIQTEAQASALSFETLIADQEEPTPEDDAANPATGSAETTDKGLPSSVAPPASRGDSVTVTASPRETPANAIRIT